MLGGREGKRKVGGEGREREERGGGKGEGEEKTNERKLSKWYTKYQTMHSWLTLNLFHSEVGGPCMINACMTRAL